MRYQHILMTRRIPFQERKTPWRGLLDLVTGRYPRFLFGGGTGACLPVFHFHEVTAHGLEPYLRRLADNGYRTITSEALAAYVLRGVHPGVKSVMLCFDDAWASLWTVAAPMLRKHGQQAVTFAIVGRITDAESVRPVLGQPGFDPLADRSATPYCTWPELQALAASGTIDVQAHTWHHAKMFCDQYVTGFITPGFALHPHDFPHAVSGDVSQNLPAWPDQGGPARRALGPADLGAPLYLMRSTMSDALEYHNSAARQACMEQVKSGGGIDFFSRPDWEKTLRDTVARYPGRFETESRRDERILAELAAARHELNHRLGHDRARHMCFPWAIAGQRAAALAARAGYGTAFADRLFGYRAVRAQDPPFRLMRLRHELIVCLPGQNRRTFLQARRTAQPASAGQV